MKRRARVNQLTEPRVTITIRMPLSEKIAIIEEAKKRDITVTELIRKAVQEIIGTQKKIPQWPKPRALGIRQFPGEDLYE